MIRRAAALATLLLLLAGCSAGPSGATSSSEEAGATTASTPATPLSLVGEWRQANSKSPDSYQTATISADTITVNWVSDGGETTALYWAGSYIAPTTGESSYTWDSVNDTTQTETAMLASSDATKTFTLEDGTLNYSVSALGVTTTVKLAREQ